MTCGLGLILLTSIVKEWEAQVSVSTNWDPDVAVVDDEAKCEIEYDGNKNKSNFSRSKIDFTATWGY